tara:strand:- start:87 stop:308 length:222 start_codon:yes stop_codon:yes gene_type:complete
MKLKEKQWTTTGNGWVSDNLFQYDIAYCVDGNLKKFIHFTYAEHYHQFTELLKEAGYEFVKFNELKADSILSV